MTQEAENFAALLAGLSDRQIREFCIEAVRRVRKKGDRASTVRLDPGTIQHELVPLLRQHHNKTDESHVPVASLLMNLNEDWATPLLEFFIWLERAGLAFRYGGTPQEIVQRIRLLPAGLAFFDAEHDAHPLVPGWVERLKTRCLNLTPETYDLLVDSHACYERGLLRASIALLGVAIEGVIEDAYNTLLAAGFLLPAPHPNNAVQRLVAVRAGVALKFPNKQDRETRRNAEHACDFADYLRQRRNDAAHRATLFAFDDRTEIEDLLTSAALQLPALHALF